MTGENGRENFYQKTVGSKASTPIEVVDMGLRGFTRKIGILKDYNANFQCGQCHNAANRYLTYKWLKDDKPVRPEDLQKAGVSPYATEFLRIPSNPGPGSRRRDGTKASTARPVSITSMDRIIRMLKSCFRASTVRPG